MFKKRTKNLLIDRFFWIIIFLFVASGLLSLCYVSVSVPDRAVPGKIANKPKPAETAAASGVKTFIITCFDHDMGIRCKSKKNGHCSDEFQKDVKAICANLQTLGVAPFEKIAVDLKKYDVCDEKLEKETGCVPYFSPEGRLKGYNMASIYLPATLFRDKESLRIVLTHELTHALTFRDPVVMARIVREFFAVYAESIFCTYNIHNTCNGPEWNQPVLRNYGGEYSFPSLPDNKPMKALASCRYGQLEYIVRKLHRQSPFLFQKLWRELLKHDNGKMDTAWLKKQIAKIDNKAGEIVSKFHILSEADASPQLAVVGRVDEYCVFVYKNAGKEDERFDARSGFHQMWRRGKKVMAYHAVSLVPIACYPADKFLSGDTIDIRAVGFGKSFHRMFVVP